MKKAKHRCTLCGRELGMSYRKLILRDAEERGHSTQLFTVGEMDICDECKVRFDDFMERCRLSAEE